MINKRALPILLFATLSCTVIRAQLNAPLITGTASISIRKGTIACDFILSNLPAVKNYVIRLNSGMNIHYFKDLKRDKTALYYDMDTKDSIESDATKAYYLHENRGNPARYIPEVLEVKYMGWYPVVADSASGYMGQDWRGNIAFNGYSVRAEGLQGDWYPEIYDMDKRRLYDEVRYDIHVSCEDCSVLFVNGSSPVKGTKGEFKSGLAREMAIYCGKFQTSEDHGIWLLNAGLTKPEEQKFFTIASTYQAFYEKAFDIPFKGSLAYVQTTPVADPRNWGFGFYAAPTTFNVAIGEYGLQSVFDKDHADKNKQSMAHELGHYYFGTLLRPQGTLGFVLAEGFAEFLSYELTRSVEGESVYRGLLRQKVKALENLRGYQPLALVKTEADFGDREYYLYYYAPVLFLAIEKEIGKEAMWKWLKAMVSSGTDVTDYSFLLSTLRTAIGNDELTEKIRSTYFTSDDALKAAMATLRDDLESR